MTARISKPAAMVVLPAMVILLRAVTRRVGPARRAAALPMSIVIRTFEASSPVSRPIVAFEAVVPATTELAAPATLS